MSRHPRALSLFLVFSTLLTLALLLKRAMPVSGDSGVWATETLDGADYSIHMSMYDQNEVIPTGPLGPEHERLIRNIWVTEDATGSRLGSAERERQIVLQAQNRMLLNETTDWISADEINSEDKGIVRTWESISGFPPASDGYFFSIRLPAAYSTSELCQDSFRAALYLGWPGGVQYEGQRKRLYGELVKRLVFQELAFETHDSLMQHFASRFGAEYDSLYEQVIVGGGGTFADLTASLADEITTEWLWASNYDDYFAYAEGLQTFSDSLQKLSDKLAQYQAVDRLYKDAYEGYLMHAYVNGLAAERMAALSHFAHNKTGLDPAFVDAVDEFAIEFQRIVDEEFGYVLERVFRSLGDTVVHTAKEAAVSMLTEGWGYFGVGLKILIRTFEYLHGRDDVVRTLAMIITIQDELQVYLQNQAGTLPLRELLLLNNMKQYLSYAFYAENHDRIDLSVDFLCWQPEMSATAYRNYLAAERDARLTAYQNHGPTDFLASDVAPWVAEKLQVPAVHSVAPAGPVTVTKPDPIHFDVEASDDTGIVRVDFRSGDYVLGSDTDGSDGWSLDWNTVPYPAGQHLMEVVAWDEHGKSGKGTVSVEVVDLGYTHDLSIYDLQTTTPDPMVGDPVDISATVENRGVVEVSSAPITLYVDEQPIDTTYVTLQPAETTTVNFTWTSTPGAHNVRVQAELEYDEHPENDFSNLVLGSTEPGVLEVGGSASPPALRLNLEPGTASEHYVVLRNNGDVGLNVSVTANPSSHVNITFVSANPVFVAGNSSVQFHFRVNLDSSAPLGQDFDSSLDFSSAGGAAIQALTVTSVEVSTAGGEPIVIPLASGWVDVDPDYYQAAVDFSPWRELIDDGLVWHRLRFTADSVDTCDNGDCNFTTYELDGAWFPCSGSSHFMPSEVPVALENGCSRSLIGDDSRTYKIVASSGDRFHVDPVTFEFLAYDGDPDLELSRQFAASTIYVNETATVQLTFNNVGSNRARDPQYDESPLPYNLSLVSGSLSGEANSVDPGEQETVSYVIQAAQPGEYVFPNSTVVYYNPTRTHAYQSSFGNSTLTVLGGELQPNVTFNTGPYYYGQPQTIFATVTESLTGNTVSGADVQATVTTPDSQTHQLPLLYDSGLDMYVGEFHDTYALGTYSVHVDASQDYYTDGSTIPDATFDVVTPYALDLAHSGSLTWTTSYETAVLPFNLTNTGATGDTAFLDALSIPTAWNWGVIPGTVTLSSGQTAEGAVIVEPSVDTVNGLYSIDLRASSKGDEGITDTVTLDLGLDNTPPSVDALSVAPTSVVPGDSVVVTANMSEAVTMTADFSRLDESWDMDRTTVTEVDSAAHIYEISYTLSDTIAIADGHYPIHLEAVDLAGNAAAFVTADVALERNAPQFVSSDPHSGETIPFGGQTSFQFSEPMDQAATVAAFTITPSITGTLTWADEESLVFAPNIYYEPDTTYTITVGSGAQDLAGNSLSSTTISFYVAPLEQTVVKTINVGWNLVSLSVQPSSGFETAEDLCDALAAGGAHPTEIDRWYAGGWDSHICGLSFNDFSLVLGEGYFVRADQGGQLSVTGLAPLDSMAIPLNSGWNLVGIPEGITHTAESAGQEINRQGGDCTEIDRWYAGGWDSHIFGFPFNNFDLTTASGYFIRCEAVSSWLLSPAD